MVADNNFSFLKRNPRRYAFSHSLNRFRRDAARASGDPIDCSSGEFHHE
jgi:hypothetical protein